MSVRQHADDIDAQAAGWVVRRDREGDSSVLEAELDRWLAEDIRHSGALLKAEATWALLGRSETPALAPAPVPAHAPSRGLSTGRLSRRMVLGGMAGSLAAALAAVLVLPTAGDHYRTEVGEIRRVALADRSTAAINTASDIAVVYQKEQRLIRLEEGEVWFQVAKDPARPFRVEAGQVRVEAVGTAFSVRRREAGADILVTEGVVKAWVEGAEGSAIQIQAGSHAFVADTGTVDRQVAQPSQLDRQLAWRGGKIDLAGDTLAHAVSEFNRYNARKITVADAEAGRKRFHGVFRIDDPEGFARAASISLGLRASATPDGDIAIASGRGAK